MQTMQKQKQKQKQKGSEPSPHPQPNPAPKKKNGWLSIVPLCMLDLVQLYDSAGRVM
jgi:hypothetical protein